MKDFNGVLICTDLDGTLLNSDMTINEKNQKMIKRFISDGGSFTFASGRIPSKMEPFAKVITPTVPVIAYSGGAIYDYKSGEYLAEWLLDDEAEEVLHYIEEHYQSSAFEVYKREKLYSWKDNEFAAHHRNLELFPDNFVHFSKVPFPWSKAMFIQNEKDSTRLVEDFKKLRFSEKYNFVRSERWYFEIIPKGVDKGNALLKLAQICKFDIKRIIAFGDNENDMEMMKRAGLGIAMDNASEYVKTAADMVTASNSEGGIADVIEKLYDGKIEI